VPPATKSYMPVRPSPTRRVLRAAYGYPSLGLNGTSQDFGGGDLAYLFYEVWFKHNIT